MEKSGREDWPDFLADMERANLDSVARRSELRTGGTKPSPSSGRLTTGSQSIRFFFFGPIRSNIRVTELSRFSTGDLWNLYEKIDNESSCIIEIIYFSSASEGRVVRHLRRTASAHSYTRSLESRVRRWFNERYVYKRGEKELDAPGEKMPNWTSVVRLLRRRLVLGIIFAMSLTYCAISLLSHEKLGNSLRMRGEESMHGNEDSAVEEEDEIFRGSGKHLAWQMELENNYDGVNPESANSNAAADSNDTSVVARMCRNSVQGKALIVDERGFVCARSEVSPTGCCTTILENVPENSTDVMSVKRRRYSCETCNPQGCCAIYEYCVSCCLQPNKRRSKKDAKSGTEDRRNGQKARRGEDAVRLRLRNLDRFQVCLAACRTSSASVRHENTYKDPESKHCYSINYQRNRRDDSNNNNDDNARAVVTSSSTLKLLIRTFARRPSDPVPERNERSYVSPSIDRRTRCRECLGDSREKKIRKEHRIAILADR